MPLDEVIMTVFCCRESLFPEVHRASPGRQRGGAPRGSDSAVLPMATGGAWWGIDADKQLWHDCRRHWLPWLPTLGSRRSCVRHAAHWWGRKPRLQAHLADS